MPRILRTVVILSSILILPGAARGGTVESMLENEELVDAYNPELVEFLLEEGAAMLPEGQRRKALDQLVASFKSSAEITPEEQKKAALAAAGSALLEVFGGSDGRELGAVAGDATYQVWKGWVDSAFILQRAGYTEDAERFFERCLEIYPYFDLKGRCALGLAEARPSEAVERLVALTREGDEWAVRSALRMLADLALQEGVPSAERAAIVAHLTEFASGMKRATYGATACEALVRIGDPSIRPTLTKLSTGMMNRDIQPCAQRALLLNFGDRSMVPLLEKKLKGGAFSTVEPSERLRAAALLMRAGEPSGFAWARVELTRKKKKGFKKLMKTSEEPDYKADLVPTLAEVGGAQALEALRAGFEVAEPGSWIRTWIAIGLLEAGDDAQIELVRRALDEPEWDFTVVRVATALARQGDRSGVSALSRLYGKAAAGVEPARGRRAMAFLAGRGGEVEASIEAQRRRLRRLKFQIAEALVEIGGRESVLALSTMLGDEEPSIRVAAARSLTRMDEAEAAGALEGALEVDYGQRAGRSESPIVHARILRRLARAFPSQPETAEAFAAGKASPYRSVRFLALSGAPATIAERAEPGAG